MPRPFLLLALALAGCIGAPGVGSEPHALHGTFTVDRTQADLDAVCAIARDHGSECILMESFPEQFRLTFESADDCAEARARIGAVDRARPGACEPVPPRSGEPDAPTSSDGSVG